MYYALRIMLWPCNSAISIFALKTLECIAFYYTIKPRLYMVSYHNLLYVVTLMPNICSSFLQVTVQLYKEEVHTWKPFGERIPSVPCEEQDRTSHPLL